MQDRCVSPPPPAAAPVQLPPAMAKRNRAALRMDEYADNMTTGLFPPEFCRAPQRKVGQMSGRLCASAAPSTPNTMSPLQLPSARRSREEGGAPSSRRARGSLGLRMSGAGFFGEERGAEEEEAAAASNPRKKVRSESPALAFGASHEEDADATLRALGSRFTATLDDAPALIADTITDTCLGRRLFTRRRNQGLVAATMEQQQQQQQQSTATPMLTTAT